LHGADQGQISSISLYTSCICVLEIDGIYKLYNAKLELGLVKL